MSINQSIAIVCVDRDSESVTANAFAVIVNAGVSSHLVFAQQPLSAVAQAAGLTLTPLDQSANTLRAALFSIRSG